MSLKIWLPLNGNLKNQGLSSATIIASGAEAVSGGKLGGQTYSFDGSDDYISIDSSSLYDCFKGGESPFTIAMWIYFNETTGGRGVLFGDYNLSGAINFNLELNSSSNWNNDVRFYWAGSPDYRATNTAITSNTWVHLAVVYDGTQLKFYRNGILVNTREGTLSAKNKTAGVFYLGRDSRTGATAFNGKLNDVRIYDECLSDKEIKEIYKTLILHYKLNNSIKVKDSSGYGYNATVFGYLTDYVDSPVYDNCIRFDYSSSTYVVIPTINFSDFANNFTISWWSKIENMNGKMAWGFKDGNRLNLYPTSSKFCCNTGDGANNSYMSGSSTIPFAAYNNGWHHYVMTANGTDNKLYIDGIYKGTAQTYKGITGTQIILSGWDTGTSYKWTQGYLSDFRIYATALSDEDILQLSKTKMIIDNKQNLYTNEFKENNYAQLDYLESTGTQYILTNIKMKDVIRVDLKFQCLDTNTNQGIYGGYVWVRPSGYSVNLALSVCLHGNVNDSKFHTIIGDDRDVRSFDTSLHRVTILPSREIWDNGGGGSSSVNTVTTVLTIPIFALRNDNGAEGFKDFSRMKLYYIKFYNNSGQLLGDFVPALDTNNVACLYDKVTQQFYYNQGTGNFSYGSVTKDMRNKFKIQKNGILENKDFKECDINFPEEYKRLDYIEGTGTQWIDLNTKLPYQFRIELNMTITDASRVNRGFYGVEANDTKPALWLGTELSGSTGYSFYFKYNDITKSSSTITANNWNILHRVYQYRTGTYMQYSTDGGSSYGGATGTISDVLTDSLYLFKINGSSANPAKMKVYSLKIYAPDNTTLIRNFVPAEDKNGIACLFDIVSKTTFYNQGTGSFVKGNYITPESNIYYNKVQLYNNKVISNNFYEI